MNAKGYLPLLVMSLLFPACEDELPEKNSHRISEMYIHESEERKSEYFYDHDRLVRIDGYLMVDSAGWKQTSSIEYRYDNEEISEILFEWAGGVWLATEKRVHVTDPDKIIEQAYWLYDDDEWKVVMRYEFTYSGDDLTEYIQFTEPVVNNELVPGTRQVYNYENHKLQEVLTYVMRNDEWNMVRKLNVGYSGTEASEYLYYRIDQLSSGEEKESPDRKGVFTREGGWVKRVDYYRGDPQTGGWDSQSYRTDEYTYDEMGYLTSLKRSGNTIRTYVYEEGHGNAPRFRLFPDFNIFVFPGIKSANKSHFGQINPYP